MESQWQLGTVIRAVISAISHCKLSLFRFRQRQKATLFPALHSPQCKCFWPTFLLYFILRLLFFDATVATLRLLVNSFKDICIARWRFSLRSVRLAFGAFGAFVPRLWVRLWQTLGHRRRCRAVYVAWVALISVFCLHIAFSLAIGAVILVIVFAGFFFVVVLSLV